MKKIWKNFCIGALAVTSLVGFSGCGREKPPVSVDLDSDGVISEWETLFESAKDSDRLTIANVVEINSLSELKAINDSTETKVYKLGSNIDCGGETLSINLGKSSLYGNNKVIKNFKLGNCSIFNEGEGGENIVTKGLFYNGVAVYDLRLFMGNQTFAFQDANSKYTISPFVNVPIIDGVTVKGKIDVDRKYTNIDIELSLLASSVEGKRTDLSITNCTVIGDIEYSESESVSVCYAGAIAPRLWSDDLVYNCNVNAEINVYGSEMRVGLVAGQSNGFVSTVHTSGSIVTSYYSMGDGYVGGVVGYNGKTAEIKNATTDATISYNKDIALSGEKEFAVGGVAGYNNGVISYSTSDATLNINQCDATVYMGSIAGRSEQAIYYNIIARGKLNPVNCNNLFIADVVGYAQYGYFEKIITNVNIDVNNSEISSKVNIGLVTIFENLGSSFNTEAKYNAEYTPNFKSILIGGNVNVYTNSPVSSGDLKYNLGLRNEYEYYLRDEEGNIIKDVIEGEEGEEIEIPLTDTLIPNIYSSLYILDSYSFNKYKIVEGAPTLETGLQFTYAKDANGNQSVTPRTSNVALQLNFFVRNLGFNYVVGNNEIDLSSFEIPKMKFTVDKDYQLDRYFRYNHKDYNGNLSAFDKEFESLCTYDINDEMFSYLNKLITTETEKSYSTYAPILVSKEFATSMNIEIVEPEIPEEDVEEEEGEEDEDSSSVIEDTLPVADRFVRNVSELLKLMKISTQEQQFTSFFEEISPESYEDQVVKYIRLTFSDTKYTYSIEFDVTEMVNDVDKLSDNYVVFMKFNKDKK